MLNHLKTGASSSLKVWLVLAVLLLASAPCGPTAMLSLEDLPDKEELVLFEELSEWVGYHPAITYPRATQEPLRQVIRDRWTSFEVFTQYHDESVRYQPLSSVPFGADIRRAAEQHGIDGLLLAAMVEVESGFNPRAVSHKGAVGLMQVMPSSAVDHSDEQLRDPVANLSEGTRYLGSLLELFGGDLELALAAYNAGPGAVRRYDGVPPYRETRNYLEKVLSLYIALHQQVWQASEDGELLASVL